MNKPLEIDPLAGILSPEELRKYSEALVKASEIVWDASRAHSLVLSFILLHVAMWGEDPGAVGEESSLLLTLKRSIASVQLSDNAKAWAITIVESARMEWKLLAASVNKRAPQ